MSVSGGETMLNPDQTGQLSAGLLEVPIRSPVSRRSLLRGAALASAAGLTAYSLAGASEPALAAADSASAADRTGQAGPTAGTADIDTTDELVVHIRQTKSGQLDIFRGTNQTTVRDPDLVARLVRASRS
jgi:hypothetical protein